MQNEQEKYEDMSIEELLAAMRVENRKRLATC